MSAPGGATIVTRDSLVGLLGQGVELSNGVVKGLLGEVTSSVGRVEDLVAKKVRTDRIITTPSTY